MPESATTKHPSQSRSNSVSLPLLRLDINKKTKEVHNATSDAHVEMRLHQWSDALHQFWRQSLLRATFSTSLPQTEESEFEEKFKYMIVTSPFISSDTPSSSLGKNKKNVSSPHMTTDYSTPATRVSRAGKVGTAATMAGLLMALGAETIMVIQQQYDENDNGGRGYLSFRFLTSATMLVTASMASFFVYRHKRRSDIRQLYHTALVNLQALMEQCEALDTKVSRSILMIEEVESLCRRRTCTLLRPRVQAVLRRGFIVFEEAIIDLTHHVNKSTLSHLYDLYNARSFASLSSMDRIEEDQQPEQLDRLRSLWQLVHAKRRECMMQFLALNIVSDARDSECAGYTDSWKSINQVLVSLADEIRAFVADIMDALETELYAPAFDTDEINTSQCIQMPSYVAADQRLKPFVESLEILDRQVRTLEAKFYVCKNDVRELAASAGAAEEEEKEGVVHDRLKQECQSINSILGDLLLKWQEGQEALLAVLDGPELLISPSTASSSPSSPAMSGRYRMSAPHALDLESPPPPDVAYENDDVLPPSPASIRESSSTEHKRCI